MRPAVGDDGVDLDEVDPDLERRGCWAVRWRRLLGGLRWGLSGSQCAAGQQHEQRDESKTCIHGHLKASVSHPRMRASAARFD